MVSKVIVNTKDSFIYIQTNNVQTAITDNELKEVKQHKLGIIKTTASKPSGRPKKARGSKHTFNKKVFEKKIKKEEKNELNKIVFKSIKKPINQKLITSIFKKKPNLISNPGITIISETIGTGAKTQQSLQNLQPCSDDILACNTKWLSSLQI